MSHRISDFDRHARLPAGNFPREIQNFSLCLLATHAKMNRA
jgi:hypothetical protein